MVYAVYGLEIKIDTDPDAIPTSELTKVTVKDVESMTVAVDGKADEWTPMDAGGWMNRLVTSKALSFGFKGKRSEGDIGNDFIFASTFKLGAACNSVLSIVFPNADTLLVPGIIVVKTPFGGDSTKISELSWDFQSNGQPTFTVGVVIP